MKDRNRFKTYIGGFLNLGPAIQRLIMASIGFLVFCHISSCLWYLFVTFGNSDQSWLIFYDLESASAFDQYIAAMYLIVQTVVTVGYGDLSPVTVRERSLICIWMIVGVLFYSLFVGFLSSLLSDLEIQSQRYSHKIHMLSKLKKEYNLSAAFTKKLKNAIKYENK
jgi:hypothetical protein